METAGNHLYPIFLKLENLRTCVVGGGHVALEKLNSILANSPNTEIHLVAETIIPEIWELQEYYPRINLIQKKFEDSDLDGAQIVFSAVNDIEFAASLSQKAKERGLLINAADKPSLCDFYLGSIVQKGNLKLAISTNGKSPTVAKRLKEILNDVLPEEMDEILENMMKIRNSLSGDFNNKVKVLNKITTDYLQHYPTIDNFEVPNNKP